MGRGAFMSVTNSTKSDVKLFVSDQHCMYDNGAEDSNVSYFNNLVVGPGQTAPAGDPQYIEVKASSTGGDTCASDTSEFKLEVTVGDDITIGTVDITERWNTFHGSSSNSDLIKVNVGNGGDQDRIEVTIVGAG